MSVLGLMADPGLPEALATAIADDLASYLTENLDSSDEEREWQVQVSQGTLPVAASGMVPLMDHAQKIQEERGWDVFFYLLDLPQWRDDEPLLCFISSTPTAALISVPALGARRLTRRTKTTVLMLVQAIQNRDQLPAHVQPDWQRVKWVTADSQDEWYVLAPGRRNKFRLLTGMVRSNRPGHILSVLSNSLAAAVGTGAFGVFYASLWRLADESSTLRLVVISLLAVGVFSTWLIVNNRLWSGAKHSVDGQRDRRDNWATVITVSISVVMLYLALLLVLLIGSLIVIAPSYLEGELDHEISVIDYVRLAWLAASLGTFAGAVGSNFDSDADIESATYNRRVSQRRQLDRETR